MRVIAICAIALLLGYDFATSRELQLSLICSDHKGAKLAIDVNEGGQMLGGLLQWGRKNYSYSRASWEPEIEGGATLSENLIGYARANGGLATRHVQFVSYPEEEIWADYYRWEDTLYLYEFGRDDPVIPLSCRVIFER